MAHRPDDSKYALFFTCVLSHLPMVAVVAFLVRRDLRFEGVVGAYSVTVSFMYHTCECFETSLFMSEGRWHRLDNIGAIVSVGCSCIQLACFENRILLEYLQYIILFIVIILQEAAPWDVRYTIVPVAVCIAVPIVSHLLNPRRRHGFVLPRVLNGLVALVLGGIFFAMGLDESNDPVRIYHGFFHICITITIFFFFYALRPSAERKRRSLHLPSCDDAVGVMVNL
ncbi:Protein of unknown function (DUF3522) [Leishmania donovani]|uniref:Protein_of_uncharacterized_function_(DUF3522)_-_p utative n=4 Tax=Leishmania donovani species complex TaxID=38574 RepID=A0A6L0X217_LEIIN|nr:conserved hypothetical protein [Leishmania infantum JPCM5]XP_003859863.1 hypothetical protein, conserved [Leishmania donovani]CAC9476921.1 Protein_of_uncharacterised_function_(DUF3522)_-_putative [Leishmania infantum]AYU77758.1 Protein of unknown function (DUF3522), putative [Leishmania donovani]CAJ1987768.1 Protein of unknown function (DUF3522) [Leishmania donovani]CAM59686.1 conserved hypothetical protein [Leishmania infantum JPCM5]CBZ33156.1 hypothetical protein, conserved [Leishmania d|eukprot:XP_001464658.1 conserved hypothetical protein [Leishmania infantum JPCM5]